MAECGKLRNFCGLDLEMLRALMANQAIKKISSQRTGMGCNYVGFDVNTICGFYFFGLCNSYDCDSC